jgi:putative endonuclease
MGGARIDPQAPDRRQLGQDAEDAALAHLVAQGLSLLARNVRYPFGEVDLVLRDGPTVVFAEVRFRRGAGFGGAAASVDAAKRRKLVRASQAWLKHHREFAQAPCRFDVVAVSPRQATDRDGLHCDWIASAFTLDDLW